MVKPCSQTSTMTRQLPIVPKDFCIYQVLWHNRWDHSSCNSLPKTLFYHILDVAQVTFLALDSLGDLFLPPSTYDES